MESFNIYSDKRKTTKSGHGVDISTQRADDLDNMCLEQIKNSIMAGHAINALDIACGMGGQAQRMSALGAQVTATDIVDYREVVQQNGAITFVLADMTLLDHHLKNDAFDLAICQRAIHYLPYNEAQRFLAATRNILKPHALLYLSASGIQSELGLRYQGKKEEIKNRFCRLTKKMADKHNIQKPVCLYSEEDLTSLLKEQGFHIEKVYSSAFGNIKVVARVVK